MTQDLFQWQDDVAVLADGMFLLRGAADSRALYPQVESIAARAPFSIWRRLAVGACRWR